MQPKITNPKPSASLRRPRRASEGGPDELTSFARPVKPAILVKAACIAAALEAMEEAPRASPADQLRIAMRIAQGLLRSPVSEKDMLWAFEVLGHPIDAPAGL